MATFRKDADATLDYSVDWSAWLADGDTIAAADWTVPDGLQQPTTPTPSLAGAKATVWLTGGTVGDIYPVTCRITTAQGRSDARSIRIRVVQR